MSNISRDEKQTIIELLETTIPFNQKAASLIGRENYASFIRIRKDWKRRLSLYYTNVQNYSGIYSTIFLENIIDLIEEYHDIGTSRYADIILDNPEMITRMSAGTQSLLLQKITEETAEIKDAQYEELTDSTDFDAITKALSITLDGEAWIPKGAEARGPLFVSQVTFMVEAIKYAYEYYKKALLYHAERQKEPEKYPNYWEQFSNYIFTNYNQKAIPFRSQTVEISIGESILLHLESIFPKSIKLADLVKAIDKPKNTLTKVLCRLVDKELVNREGKGVYVFNDIRQHTTEAEEE